MSDIISSIGKFKKIDFLQKIIFNFYPPPSKIFYFDDLGTGEGNFFQKRRSQRKRGVKVDRRKKGVEIFGQTTN